MLRFVIDVMNSYRDVKECSEKPKKLSPRNVVEFKCPKVGGTTETKG
jgi:hypothetical protein